MAWPTNHKGHAAIKVNSVGSLHEQVADKFYFLPNPYPEGKLVAKMKQTSSIVDSEGRDVPLSEVSDWCSNMPQSLSSYNRDSRLQHNAACSISGTFSLQAWQRIRDCWSAVHHLLAR